MGILETWNLGHWGKPFAFAYLIESIQHIMKFANIGDSRRWWQHFGTLVVNVREFGMR